MTERTIGFIGGGRIARILLGGWARAGRLPSRIVVSDPDETNLALLKQQTPAIEAAPGDNHWAASQQVVFLAAPPPVVVEALRDVAGALTEDAIVVSLAPKFTISRITELLNGFARVARVIPNAPSLVGAGYNPLCFGHAIHDSERGEVRDLFESLGACPEVDENKLEAYAVLTAMGPTYFWPQFTALKQLAVEFGLTESESHAGLAAMAAGALRAMTESRLDEHMLLDLIPAKPLGAELPAFCEAYRTRLAAVYEKIRP
ncbi:MAG: NAD(P)-binding domain-containing protein [Pirellulaceae bacterium]